jgi:polyvinyl alcohol dehydrogenase (cytochrome)
VVIPGAVFAGSDDGHIRAYSSSDGRIVWDFDTAARPYDTVNLAVATGGTVRGASQIVANGVLYVNSGYMFTGHTPGNVLLAFGVGN